MRPLPAIPSPTIGVSGRPINDPLPAPPLGMMPPLINDFFPSRPIDIGGGGIESLLRPLLDRVNSGYQQDVVQPYVQQVEELTTSTFPDINFGGIGSLMPMPQPRPGGGGSLLELFRPTNDFLAQTLR